MVYDEGFEFNLGKKDSSEFSSYFTFLKFSKNDFKNPTIKSKHYSHCYYALIGWYHSEKNKWGCFWGHKKNVDYNKPTNGEADDKLLVVENVVKSAFIAKNEIQKLEEEKNILNKQEFLKNFDTGRFMQTEFNNRNKLNNKLSSRSMSLLSLDSEFTNHEEVVERINSMNLSWKAEVYEEFKGKTIAEINKFSGRNGKENSKFEELKFRKIRNNLKEQFSSTMTNSILYF